MLPLLWACAADDPTTDTASPPTPTGEEELPPVEQALEDLKRCQPGTDDGTLDIEAACAGDVCLGTSWPDVSAALGPPDFCSFVFDATTCGWSGLNVGFADGDGDGTPDDDAQAYLVAINPPWDGGTTDGLALDATVGCFVDVLGTPDGVSFGSYPAGWFVRSLAWDDLYFTLYDYGDPDGAGRPDGLPDFVQFTNYLFF
jgi:hypothetical protein